MTISEREDLIADLADFVMTLDLVIKDSRGVLEDARIGRALGESRDAAHTKHQDLCTGRR